MLPWYTLALLIPIKIAALAILAKGTRSGEIRPNRSSLLLWSLPPLVGFCIAFTEGATFSAIPLLLAGIAPIFLLTLSFLSKRSPWKTGALDYVSGAFSIAAIAVWIASDGPTTATLMLIVADIFAGIPTFAKTWKNGSTESAPVYLLGFLGNGIGLLTLRHWELATAGFGVYLLFFNVFMAALIVRGRIVRFFR